VSPFPQSAQAGRGPEPEHPDYGQPSRLPTREEEGAQRDSGPALVERANYRTVCKGSGGDLAPEPVHFSEGMMPVHFSEGMIRVESALLGYGPA
jgi:hypothetical protein